MSKYPADVAKSKTTSMFRWRGSLTNNFITYRRPMSLFQIYTKEDVVRQFNVVTHFIHSSTVAQEMMTVYDANIQEYTQTQDAPLH